MVMAISKKAAKLIAKGLAEWSSGGVRDKATGQFIELAKPVLKNGLGSINLASMNPVFGVANLVSSLGNNVQSAFIQKSLNEANVKLDNVITRLDSIAQSINALGAIHALSWANLALSIANCGISVAGFKMTLSKLNKVTSQLTSFYDRYKRDQSRRLSTVFETIRGYLINDIDDLSRVEAGGTVDFEAFNAIAPFIKEHIIQARAFLENDLIPQFKSRDVDGPSGCLMIFTLVGLYAQVVNEFCALSYYANHQLPQLSAEWRQTVHALLEEPFKSAFRQNLMLDPAYMELDPYAKFDAVKVALEGVRESSDRLEACALALPQITLEQYLTLDDAMALGVTEALKLEYPSLQNGMLEEQLSMAISDNDYTEDEDVVMVPIHLEASAYA